MELLSWHRVGQRVVYVNPWAYGDPARGLLRSRRQRLPEAGGVYTIATVERRGDSGQIMFQLAGFAPSDGYEPWWRFRPVCDTSIESLRALLHPTPETRRQLEEMDA